MRTTRLRTLLTSWLCLVAAGCSPTSSGPELPPPVGPTNHRWFPLEAGTTHEFGKAVPVDGVMACESCHPATAASFTEFQCLSCHKHPLSLTQRLHLGVTDYVATSAGCYQCHPTGADQPFSHTQITNQCAECHAEGNAFAALPKAGFTHRSISGDCSGCHLSTTTWTEVSAAPTNASDPARDVTVNALQPTWVGTTIISVTPDPQVIPMTMNHLASAVDAGVLADCAVCHAQADQGQYYPGVMHWSLISLGLPQPTVCTECHGSDGPRSFVGALDPRRSPSSGEMRHDAVVWNGNAPTTTKIVSMDCAVCHQAPNDLVDARWTFALGNDGGVTTFHGSLTAASVAQPTACLDCHANTRPIAPVVSATLTFDHGTALGECSACHRSVTDWAGGQFHSATAPALSTCLPCHGGDRPNSTTGWLGTFLTSPFDSVTNSNGVTHGADQDCVVCHSGPGTGVWGTNQNWRSGTFSHAQTTIASTTCIDCHTTQRPDLLTPPVDAGYDHASNGTGDCYACHQATVTRGVYVALLPIPGGDWRGGASYPGDRLISTPGLSVRVQSTTLNRTGAMVTSMTTGTVNLPNAFLHTSTQIPVEVFPGSATVPDQASCWHCHTSSGTTVISYSNGRFHSALTNYEATPASAVTPLAQPTSCNDCHGAMRPPNVVSRTDAGTWLLPMDHGATFTGGSVANVAAMDCGACHGTPGLGPTQWSDGQFHGNLPTGAAPSECVSCHYPLMTTAQADVTAAGTPSTYTMKHRSPLLTTQACATCHSSALGKSTLTPASTLWKPGSYHPTLTATTQPATCLECHSGSDPVTTTQGTTGYAMPQGGTATNGAQWMNHAHVSVTGKDCASCHLADAKVTGSAWNRGAAFHSRVTGLTTCATCHGLTNGRGTVVGTSNNLPAGLIDTATFTTSSAAAPSTPDQIAHTDPNVTGKDCSFCHSLTGTTPGREWAKALFHRSFSTASPMAITRCTNCHMNVRPGTAYPKQNHSTFTETSAQDCSACHSWPGTGTATAPNWLGATGAHAATGPTATSTLDCNTCHGLGGSSSKHLTAAASGHYGGISNGNKCTSCHINFAGFKGTVSNLKYAHTNPAAQTQGVTSSTGGCANCHTFTAQLYTTLTTTPPLTFPTAAGGHQFSQTKSVTGSRSNCGDTNPNGCFTAAHNVAGLARCASCHQYVAPTATANVWVFKHEASNPGVTSSRSSSGCTMCH